MNEQSFWKHIKLIDTTILVEDEEAAVEPLVAALTILRPQEIQCFLDKLAFMLYQLDGPEYMDNSGESSQSDDGFLYARSYVVALGQESFERCKADPTLMPKSSRQQCESLLYAAVEAWSRATGEDEENWTTTPTPNYDTGSNEYLWKR